MSDEENDEREEREEKLSEQADETAHPFDQTNGMAEGLEGDADEPEQADKRMGNGGGVGFLAAPAPGSQMAGGAIPTVAGKKPGDESDADGDADDPTPA